MSAQVTQDQSEGKGNLISGLRVVFAYAGSREQCANLSNMPLSITS